MEAVFRPMDEVGMAGIHKGPSNVRQGRFLCLPEEARNDYLATLKRKIAEGYFFSDSTITRLAEDLAPAYSESTGSEL